MIQEREHQPDRLVLPAIAYLSGVLAVMAAMMVTSSTSGAGAAAWINARKGKVSLKRQRVSFGIILLGVFGFVSVMIWLLLPGGEVPARLNAASLSGGDVVPMAAPDPSQVGKYEIQEICYGSGTGNRPDGCGGESPDASYSLIFPGGDLPVDQDSLLVFDIADVSGTGWAINSMGCPDEARDLAL